MPNTRATDASTGKPSRPTFGSASYLGRLDEMSNREPRELRGGGTSLRLADQPDA
ncbi:MAG TPA: hypothetical protein VE569_07775 [Acidimicrobiia bacterium]|nr:hypothetical protein [Acidimicrobiia bacterium]